MLNLVAAVAWLGTLILGAAFVVAKRTRSRKRITNGLLAYVLAVSLIAGLSGRSLWPFDSWQMFPYLITEEVSSLELFGVDQTGDEHRIDSRAWEPVPHEELFTFLGQHVATLEPHVQDSVLAFVLAQANGARDRALRGRPVGTFARFLGPLTAPTHFLHPHIWSDSANVPPHPFTKIRLVRWTWPVLRHGYMSGRRDSVVFEFPRDPT